jgi:aspartate/methionine/tyrosine aminotransferase
MITSGTSGALMLAFQALLNPGDEAIIPDPYFAMYPHICTMVGAVGVPCDTYPDFRLTAARVEKLITPRTKLVLLNSPSNPAGVVASNRECQDLLELCRAKNVLLISDEIYDTFTYADACEPSPLGGAARCPSPARFPDADQDVFLIRGFGKTYGVTGDRSALGAAQTPQGFRATLLREAYRHAEREGLALTDEAMAVEALGHPVIAVPGLASNRKLTTLEDLEWAEYHLRREAARA